MHGLNVQALQELRGPHGVNRSESSIGQGGWPSACLVLVDIPSGGRIALRLSVAGLHDFREFAAWQRAEELRVHVQEFLLRPGLRARFRRADQLDDAAAAAPRNIAEGFGRFKPRQFAQFVRIAKGSETEVLNILAEARQSGFLSATDFEMYEVSARRAIGTATGLIRYLEKAEEPTSE